MLSLKVFKIVGISRIDAETVKVKVRIDAKEWTKLRNAKALGHLYCTDIGNEACKVFGIKPNPYYPTVSDTDNAQGGIKWVSLYYRDTLWTAPIDNVIRVDFINRRRAA